MSLGLEDAAGVAAFVSLSVTALQGCVKGLTLISQAKGHGVAVIQAQTIFDIQRHQLQEWAVAAGLLDEPPRPKFAEKCSKEVGALLALLEARLSDVKALAEKYDLSLEEVEDASNDSVPELASPNSIGGPIPVARRFVSGKASVLHNQTGLWKKFKWATFDEAKARRLLDDIDVCIKGLYQILPPREQQHASQQLEIVRRVAVASSDEPQILSSIIERERRGPQFLLDKAVVATAQLREKGLLYDMFEKSDVTALTERKRKREDITESPSASSTGVRTSEAELVGTHLGVNLYKSDNTDDTPRTRETGFYDGVRVMVEWQGGGTSGADTRKTKERIARVALLLTYLADSAFHSLPCRGYMEHPVHLSYGLVFSLTEYMQQTDRGSKRSAEELAGLRYQTLFDAFDINSEIPTKHKVDLAVSLLDTVLQLHTAGWLHKEIRSENLICVLEGPEQHATIKASRSLNSPKTFLAGYAYARADLSPNFTMTLPSQTPSEVYRHPHSGSPQRPTFRKTFDLFSVGCVLLEIALWKQLSKILDCELKQQRLEMQSDEHNSTQLKSQETLLKMTMTAESGSGSRLIRQVAAKMGSDYADIVVRCLQADSRARSDVRHGQVDYVLELEKHARDRLSHMASAALLL